MEQMALRLKDIPFEFHASDIVKHVINIDSRFCEQSTSSTGSKFYFRLRTPVKNVLRIKVASVELPNTYDLFSVYRRSVTLWFITATSPTPIPLVIPDGNYAATDLASQIAGQCAVAGSGLTWLSVGFNAITGIFTFSGTQPFTLNTICGTTDTYDRPYDYGLGYNLGFSRGLFPSVVSGGSNIVQSDYSADFGGDSYVFLKVNDFHCVRQTVDGYEFNALAKIIVQQPKDYMTFDDYGSGLAKEVTFPTPYDLSRFKIELLDPYGIPIDMGAARFSFSLEVLEVRNLNLYNLIRDEFAKKWLF